MERRVLSGSGSLSRGLPPQICLGLTRQLRRSDASFMWESQGPSGHFSSLIQEPPAHFSLRQGSFRLNSVATTCFTVLPLPNADQQNSYDDERLTRSSPLGYPLVCSLWLQLLFCNQEDSRWIRRLELYRVNLEIEKPGASNPKGFRPLFLYLN